MDAASAACVTGLSAHSEATDSATVNMKTAPASAGA